jgi:outer membrane receptor for ferrienterochelin and colicin
MIKSLILIVVVSLFCNVMYAQEVKKDYSQLTREEIIDLSYDELLAIPLEDLMKMAEKLGVSIDDLLNMKITVSSKTAMTSRESPGIVSIVTADEIKKSGARDLIDILNMVPGFNFGYDIDGVIGLASRGNWGHEGKILILLDGQEMNENFYSTFQFGNRIPVGQIKRIEIIRGPGSSIYGGYAELGVVNIITKEASDLKGINGGVS